MNVSTYSMSLNDHGRIRDGKNTRARRYPRI